ncbi:MAG: hypothetical protein JWL61_4985 [Gemmatimonadetes bacterium]|nr:hypothetical protein [Gemmatimonadota bacterium]
MTAKKKPAKKKPTKALATVGRPTSYQSAYARMAATACELGATDADLAKLFDVAESTINLWKLEHPEFSESVKEAKSLLDQQVEQSLYRRAMGWEHDAVKIMAVAQGEGLGSAIQEVPYVEHYPGDTTAMIFWLKNRQPARWRDRQEVEHSGKVGLEAIVAGSMGKQSTSDE